MPAPKLRQFWKSGSSGMLWAMRISPSMLLPRFISRQFSACILVFAIVGLPALRVDAQTSRDPLTIDQAEAVRDTGDKPVERVKLYMKFIEERTTEIHKLAVDPRAQAPNSRLHNLMEEFTRLADELQDNLETYSEEHADIRKPLKELVEHTTRWKASLQEPKPSADYDFARKTAMDTADSTTELAQKMLTAQEQYFGKKPSK